MLDKLVTDHLPDAALALLTPVLEARQAEQQERAAARAAREEAVARLDGIEGHISELTDEQLDEAERDLDTVWERWTPEHTRLSELLGARRAELAAGDEQSNADTAAAEG